MRMLVRVVMKQSTALIVPHTSAAVVSSLTLLDADLALLVVLCPPILTAAQSHT